MRKVIVIILILVSSVSFAQGSILDSDGNHWIQMNDDLKLGVIFGYLLAMSNTNSLVEYLKANEMVEEESVAYFDRLSMFEDSVGRIMELVDSYYSKDNLDDELWEVIQITMGAAPEYVIRGEREPHFEWMKETSDR